MYEIVRNRQFKSAFKRVFRSGKFDEEEFGKIIGLLRSGTKLPIKYYDHALKANLLDQRECHISSDLLLVYKIDTDNKIINLIDIGNHAQVFCQ